MIIIIKKKFPDTPEGDKEAELFLKKVNGAKKKAKFVLSKNEEDGNQANPDLVSEDSGYNL
tara:strand:+ start:1346 stop:1528 length:183 start_codon:yes stop_codon:yes gene_type:complete